MPKENLSPWFDPKYRIDRSSKVIPVNNDEAKKILEIPELDPRTFDLEKEVEGNKKFDDESNNGTSLKEYSPQESKYPENPAKNDFIPSKQAFQDNIVDSNNNISMDNGRIEEILEKIVFDPGELTSLKNGIKKLKDGILQPQQFKTFVLNSYIRILEDVLSFIFFILDQQLNRLKAYNPQLLKELKEKNNLLEEFGHRINSIYLNLKKKTEEEIDDYQDLNH